MAADLITDASTVEEAIRRLAGKPATIVSRSPVSGGCIANGLRLETSTGRRYFCKQSATLPPAMFTAEARGLLALRCDGGPRVPQPVAVFTGGRESFILMEWVEAGRASGGFQRRFGGKLARMHRTLAGDRFGFEADNFIGSTPQPNPWSDSWLAFFAEQRLGFQTRRAVDAGRLDARTARAVESIMGRVGDLLVEPPRPSLLHGDLWGGNFLCDSTVEPVLIDPAVYYGHPEADLAMTELFGGFGADFYGGYREVSPLQPGYRDRRDLYNLYHMLNHLNIFGHGYLAGVQSIVGRYT